jgi:hypothetical protein
MTARATDEEYAALAARYEVQPPELSGKSGYLTSLREEALINELLEPEYARLVNAQAAALKVSQSSIIQQALKSLLAAS